MFPDQPVYLIPTETRDIAANVVFKTEFCNDTDSVQEYCLKVQKTTQMTCTTEIGHGVVKSGELNAKLNIGDVLEIGGAISREVI